MADWFEASLVAGWRITSFKNVGDRDRAEHLLASLHTRGEFVDLHISRGYSEINDRHDAGFKYWEFFVTFDKSVVNKGITPETIAEMHARGARLRDQANSLATALSLVTDPFSIAAIIM